MWDPASGMKSGYFYDMLHPRIRWIRSKMEELRSSSSPWRLYLCSSWMPHNSGRGGLHDVRFPFDWSSLSNLHAESEEPVASLSAPRSITTMNFFSRTILCAAMLAVALQSSLIAAEQPTSLDQRRGEMRARMLQARMARHAAYDKREYDFYHRDGNKRS
jgi:hypothetical protein